MIHITKVSLNRQTAVENSCELERAYSNRINYQELLKFLLPPILIKKTVRAQVGNNNITLAPQFMETHKLRY